MNGPGDGLEGGKLVRHGVPDLRHFILGNFLLFREGVVVGDQPADAVRIPAGWKSILVHRRLRRDFPFPRRAVDSGSISGGAFYDLTDRHPGEMLLAPLLIVERLAAHQREESKCLHGA